MGLVSNVLMFLKVDPHLRLAVCVPYKVNCKHIYIFTIQHDNANDYDDDDHHHIHPNGLGLVKTCICGRLEAKRGDICWAAKHLLICNRLYIFHIYGIW